jgi:hypothetical protein
VGFTLAFVWRASPGAGSVPPWTLTLRQPPCMRLRLKNTDRTGRMVMGPHGRRSVMARHDPHRSGDRGWPPLAYLASNIVGVLIAVVSAVGLVFGATGLYGVDPKTSAGITATTAGILVPGFGAHDRFNVPSRCPCCSEWCGWPGRAHPSVGCCGRARSSLCSSCATPARRDQPSDVRRPYRPHDPIDHASAPTPPPRVS